jgi:hypothetical protein
LSYRDKESEKAKGLEAPLEESADQFAGTVA